MNQKGMKPPVGWFIRVIPFLIPCLSHQQDSACDCLQLSAQRLCSSSSIFCCSSEAGPSAPSYVRHAPAAEKRERERERERRKTTWVRICLRGFGRDPQMAQKRRLPCLGFPRPPKGNGEIRFQSSASSSAGTSASALSAAGSSAEAGAPRKDRRVPLVGCRRKPKLGCFLLPC